VRARALDSDYPVWGETDSNGRFLLGPLFAGDYLVDAGGNGSEFTSVKRLVVAAGADPIELFVSRGHTLRLRIIDVAGNLKPCRVLVLDPADEYELIHESLDGTIECGGLLPKTYSITALTTDGQWGRKPCSVASSIANEDIIVRPGARLVLEYDGEDTPTLVRVLVEGQVFWSYVQDRAGTTTIIVPPGPVEVLWGWGEGEDGVQRMTAEMSEPCVLLWPKKK